MVVEFQKSKNQAEKFITALTIVVISGNKTSVRKNLCSYLFFLTGKGNLASLPFHQASILTLNGQINWKTVSNTVFEIFEKCLWRSLFCKQGKSSLQNVFF